VININYFLRSQEYREVQAGFLKCPVDAFDGKFFGISPADLIYTDPQQRLLMEVVWEALEDAVIDPQSLKGTTTGVFVGSWTSDYRDLINDQGMNKIDAELTEFHRLYMGNSLGGMGGRLAYLLGLTGPNVATESGCSSGMVAIYLATESLRQGRCKVAIAGGVNLLLHPFKRKHMQSIIVSHSFVFLSVRLSVKTINIDLDSPNFV
jgi:pimaricinolide synthase PimS1